MAKKSIIPSTREATQTISSQQHLTGAGRTTLDMVVRLLNEAARAAWLVKLAFLNQRRSSLRSKKSERFKCAFTNQR